MKAFGIFNSVAWSAVIIVTLVAMADNPFGICFLLFGGGAVIAIDVVWLIVRSVIRLWHCPELAGQDKVGTSVDANLVRYLKEARARGLEDGEIEPRLIQSGWSASEIKRAHEVLKF